MCTGVASRVGAHENRQSPTAWRPRGAATVARCSTPTGGFWRGCGRRSATPSFASCRGGASGGCCTPASGPRGPAGRRPRGGPRPGVVGDERGRIARVLLDDLVAPDGPTVPAALIRALAFRARVHSIPNAEAPGADRPPPADHRRRRCETRQPRAVAAAAARRGVRGHLPPAVRRPGRRDGPTAGAFGPRALRRTGPGVPCDNQSKQSTTTHTVTRKPPVDPAGEVGDPTEAQLRRLAGAGVADPPQTISRRAAEDWFAAAQTYNALRMAEPATPVAVHAGKVLVHRAGCRPSDRVCLWLRELGFSTDGTQAPEGDDDASAPRDERNAGGPCGGGRSAAPCGVQPAADGRARRPGRGPCREGARGAPAPVGRIERGDAGAEAAAARTDLRRQWHLRRGARVAPAR